VTHLGSARQARQRQRDSAPEIAAIALFHGEADRALPTREENDTGLEGTEP